MGNEPPSPSPNDGCFAANSKIRGRDKVGKIEEKVLKDLRVGDEVESFDPLTGKLKYTRVYFIAHDDDLNPSRTVLKIKHQGETGEEPGELLVTGNHLIYISKGQEGRIMAHKDPVEAKKIQVGDYLRVRSGDTLVEKKVIEISQVKNVNILCPLTMNHRIVVNGVYASAYTINERMMKFVTSGLRMMYKAKPSLCESAVVKSCCRPFYKKAKNTATEA